MQGHDNPQGGERVAGEAVTALPVVSYIFVFQQGLLALANQWEELKLELEKLQN